MINRNKYPKYSKSKSNLGSRIYDKPSKETKKLILNKIKHFILDLIK